jgi:phosphatidylserine/phosphatidylglycerophosphate/cardiolipin synthase-like enzyme
VSSANLTQHGLHDNLEMGVLLSGQVASRAWDLVQDWTAAGLLRSLTADW